jgi:hypothetical protein
LHLQRALLTRNITQGAALGYKRTGPVGRSLSEWAYLYIIPETLPTPCTLQLSVRAEIVSFRAKTLTFYTKFKENRTFFTKN